MTGEIGPELLRYFQRRIGSDAPDLVAEVMVTVWRKRALLPLEHEHARMWCFGIARNLLRNYSRGEQRRSELSRALRATVSVTDVELDSEEAVAIRDLIYQLGPDLAEVVTLTHWEGFSLAEIARLQGVPAATVRGRYRRARLALLAALSTDVAPTLL
ncbi:RNA polymerase sigma factor [Cryobacterium tagatosivorans]|uniref:RNA polymerase sigma factor n=1 Tax=Cryobacterium tagatosivorans TaxID=1259199 RepID=A0A4R8UFQ6_9MICO|nr:RNA polymerase sigma factor [Cryobacterium tagatosivorans]